MKMKQADSPSQAEKITFLPLFLYTSSGAKFERFYVDERKTYAEYYLCTPDELFGYDFGEQLTVLWEDGRYVGYYDGTQFWDEGFGVQKGVH